MDADTAVIAVESTENPYLVAFLDLPPLGSRAYLDLLESASDTELPAQVLARAYRQLALSGNDDAARATLVRLVADPNHDYLKCVRTMARKSAMQGRNAEEEKEDLIQQTISEIICVLPTSRGSYAESAWVGFAQQCFIEAWRTINGRIGDRKFKLTRTEPTLNKEGGDFLDPLDSLSTDDHPWPATTRANGDFPWLEAFLLRIFDKIVDPNIRLIAIDHFGDDPSPIFSGASRSGKPPLVQQTGLSRFQISRAIGAIRARIFAELARQREKEIDIEKFRYLVTTKPTPIKEQDARPRRKDRRLSPAPPMMTQAAGHPRTKGN